MANDLHNLDEALAELDRISVKTSAGDFVKVEDVKRLLQQQKEVKLEEKVDQASRGKLKTMDQARAAVRKDEDIMKAFPARAREPREPGRAIPAREPQPSSRT